MVGEAHADALVIGGGVVGLMTAYELLRQGRAVTILERTAPAAGAARVGGGLLAPVPEPDVASEALVRLGCESLARYPELVAELEERTGLSCDYRRAGTLWLALAPHEEEWLARLQAAQAERKIRSALLTRSEVQGREPLVAEAVRGGLWVEGDHAVDPRKLARAVATALAREGGKLHTGYTVEACAPVDGGWRITGRRADGTPFAYRAVQVVLAAGAWSTARLDSPAARLEVKPVKGQCVRLTGADLISHVVRTRRIYLVPREGDELYLGATLEEGEPDETPVAGYLMDLIRFAWTAVPAVYNLGVAEVGAGLRPALPDGLPVVDELEPGFFVNLGHFRCGVLLAPAVGAHLADWMCTGARPAALEPFAADRPGLTAP